MDKLVKQIAKLKRSVAGTKIRKRAAEFRQLGKKSSRDLFKEMCFCLLTANYSAEGGIRIQKAVDEGFICLPQGKLAAALRKYGYRFPNVRSKYIVEARKHMPFLKQNMQGDGKTARDWLVHNVKGLGLKEASHLLRNIGFEDVAIIDFHIVDLLVENKLIKRPKTLTPKKYLAVERVLKKLALKAKINLAELDLYLWYMETGKILK